MASVPGGQYTFFANGGNTNVVATPDGNLWLACSGVNKIALVEIAAAAR